jgi:hypothetical protein
MKFNFIPQFGRGKGEPKIVCIGSFSISGKDGDAYFYDDDELCVGELFSPEIVFINQHGIMLRGYEYDGQDRSGRNKYKYQEWYCSYHEEKIVK